MDRRRLARIVVPVAAVAAVYAIVSGALRVVLGRRRQVGEAIIDRLTDDTSVDPETGAVRSIQSGDVLLPEALLADRWSPRYLERLARTYWRFLTRVTLGLVRVKYTDEERFVVLLFRPLELLAFHAPEYEMDGSRGVVRWRIMRGVLVAGRGRQGDGYLEIDVHALPERRAGAGAHPRRDRGGELLPGDRVDGREVALRDDAVAHPRARLLRLPALARPPGPGREQGRALRDDRRRARPAGAAAERAARRAHRHAGRAGCQRDGSAA